MNPLKWAAARLRACADRLDPSGAAADPLSTRAALADLWAAVATVDREQRGLPPPKVPAFLKKQRSHLP